MALVNKYFIFNCTEPGKQQLSIELRGIDQLGVPGPSLKIPVELNVKLPDTHWKAMNIPKLVEDMVWYPQVSATWAFDDIEHEIMYRINKNSWKPLGDLEGISVVQWNRQSIIVEFSSVEEKVFADPSPLSINLEVRFDKSESVKKRIQVILEADGKKSEKAFKELLFLPKVAEYYIKSRILELEENMRSIDKNGRKEIVPLIQKLRNTHERLQKTYLTRP